MSLDERMAGWQATASDGAAGLVAWRKEHPRATLAEILAAVRRFLDPLAAQMISDTVETSPAANIAATPASQRPHCPSCGGRLMGRGQQKRVLQTDRGETVRFARSYAVCVQCQLEFFPPR